MKYFVSMRKLLLCTLAILTMRHLDALGFDSDYRLTSELLRKATIGGLLSVGAAWLSSNSLLKYRTDYECDVLGDASLQPLMTGYLARLPENDGSNSCAEYIKKFRDLRSMQSPSLKEKEQILIMMREIHTSFKRFKRNHRALADSEEEDAVAQYDVMSKALDKPSARAYDMRRDALAGVVAAVSTISSFCPEQYWPSIATTLTSYLRLVPSGSQITDLGNMGKPWQLGLMYGSNLAAMYLIGRSYYYAADYALQASPVAERLLQDEKATENNTGIYKLKTAQKLRDGMRFLRGRTLDAWDHVPGKGQGYVLGKSFAIGFGGAMLLLSYNTWKYAYHGNSWAATIMQGAIPLVPEVVKYFAGHNRSHIRRNAEKAYNNVRNTMYDWRYDIGLGTVGGAAMFAAYRYGAFRGGLRLPA